MSVSRAARLRNLWRPSTWYSGASILPEPKTEGELSKMDSSGSKNELKCASLLRPAADPYAFLTPLRREGVWVVERPSTVQLQPGYVPNTSAALVRVQESAEFRYVDSEVQNRTRIDDCRESLFLLQSRNTDSGRFSTSADSRSILIQKWSQNRRQN
ncbi:hypothetical protein C8R44DRAFT_851254 [Mycena epipterygia]|nr:hypothetical protein C8R44DRAFT_851254 [Mycena epipterygia]